MWVGRRGGKRQVVEQKGEAKVRVPLLAGWLVVFWMVCRWVEGGGRRGEGHPGTKKGSLLGLHVVVASR